MDIWPVSGKPINVYVADSAVMMVGWLGFNGIFSTNWPYRAIGKVKVCLKKFISDRWLKMCCLEMLVKMCGSWELE